MPHQESEHAVAVQIMMLLTQQQARPDIPPLNSLPGRSLPGIEEYVQLMQVLHAGRLQTALLGSTMSCYCAMLCCLKTCFPTFMFGTSSAQKM